MCDNYPFNNHLESSDDDFTEFLKNKSLPKLERRKLFFKSLNLGDILYLKVIKEQPECYKLLAFDKMKSCIKIDDLSIVMELPKYPQELKFINGHQFRFIKAALSACNIKERMLYVTLDSSVIKNNLDNIHLGPIYEPYEAGNLVNQPFGISYTDSLILSGIKKQKAMQDFSNLGMNEGIYCSTLKGFQRKHSTLSSPSQIKKIHDSLSYYELAASSFENFDTHQSLQFLKQALNLWKENFEALLLAGNCYKEIGDFSYAFIYAKEAFQHHQGSSPLNKKELFKLLKDLAETFIIRNNTRLSHECLRMARIIKPNVSTDIIY